MDLPSLNIAPIIASRQVRAAAASLLDLILPPRPLDETSAPGVQSVGLSADSWSRIKFIEAPFCDGRGAPFDYDFGPNARCASCQAKPSALDHARAAADVLGYTDAVVPAPLHRWRPLKRRYNQAADIARPLAAAAGLPYRPDAPGRRRRTDSQGGKSSSGRRRNVAGAFDAAQRWRSRIAGARLLLVDDVLTTGATVESCARALRVAGAARVDVVVIARVKERPARAI